MKNPGHFRVEINTIGNRHALREGRHRQRRRHQGKPPDGSGRFSGRE